MSLGTKDDLIKSVEKHLSKPKSLIAVTQGNLKLDKGGRHNKFNWSKTDIEQKFGSVSNLIDSLTGLGFSSGAVLIMRFEHGSTTRYEGEITLNFSAPKQPSEPKPTETMSQESQNPNPPYTPPPAPAMPPAALGYTQVPQHEFISLKVLQERYNDLVESKAKAEKELSQAQSDLRTSKEDLAAANRKLELIQDKHEFELERIRKETKSFMDTDAGKAAIEAAPMLVEKLLDRLNNKQAIGLGNPIAQLSDYKKLFWDLFKDVPDEVVPTLYEALEQMINSDDFLTNLTAFIKANKVETPQ